MSEIKLILDPDGTCSIRVVCDNPYSSLGRTVLRKRKGTGRYMDHLEELENQSVFIMREAFNKFENLAMLWSIGKDSTVLLWLARKAFFGHVPFPLVHIDTTYKIPSMIEYRDRVAQEWNLNL